MHAFKGLVHPKKTYPQNQSDFVLVEQERNYFKELYLEWNGTEASTNDQREL